MKQTTLAMRAAWQREVRNSATAIAVATLLLVLSYIPLTSALGGPTSAQPANPGETSSVVTRLVHSPFKQPPSQRPSLTACTPAANKSPEDIDLSFTPEGLTTQIDTPLYYAIHGYTATDLRNQVSQCGPHEGTDPAVFTATTTYSLIWQYQISDLGESMCSLSNVKVGLHLSSIFPDWQADSYAAKGLPTRWQNFMKNLETHEHGHVELDQMYANQLLTDLQQLPAASCDTISRSAQAVIRVDTAALNVANQTYDRDTNHGTSQGAVLPTR